MGTSIPPRLDAVAANFWNRVTVAGFQGILLLLDCIPDRERIVREAKQVNPNVRIAGYTGDPESRDFPLADIVLHKPISPPVPISKIAELLDARD